MRALLALLLPLLLVPPAQAAVTLTVQDPVGVYGPGQPLAGGVRIVFDQFIPPAATLFASIDEQPTSSVSMGSHLQPPLAYAFVRYPYQFNLTATGNSSWTTSPPQAFSYTVTARGTCGTASCNPPNPNTCLNGCPATCGPPYPCPWQTSFSSKGTVNASAGLKYIYSATQSISEPPLNNKDTFWSVIVDNPDVQPAAQQACGGQTYATQPVWSDGWVRRTLYHNEFTAPPGGGTADRIATIEPFDDQSLYPGPRQTLFNGGIGGIYKNFVYQPFGAGATWDGTTGFIRIFNYDANAVYEIVYLPPNGPQVCAFTDEQQQGSSLWQITNTTGAQVIDYNSPYQKAYSAVELRALLPPPPCPPGSGNCAHTVQAYGAAEASDPSNAVTLQWNAATATATAFTTSTALFQNYSVSIPFAAFANLTAPSLPGGKNLTLSLISLGAELAAATHAFSTCQDADGDGFCAQSGDCDDGDASVRPGANESCNGLDDDCDSQIDESFWAAGSKLGNACGTGACSGVFVCTPDGKGVACSSQIAPGDFREVCDDGADNDCDGVTDEKLELVNGQQIAGCTCKEGATRPCSLEGVCRGGKEACVNGAWGECSVRPSAETCNGLDDNCDGAADNIDGAASAAAAACGCFGGAAPQAEVCNNVDDDCDGQADEGLSCCTDGDTRACGISAGLCEPGTETCGGGAWGLCQGAVQPAEEVCFNGQDDNCDGRVDEGCDQLVQACANGRLDDGEESVDCGSRCPNACGIPPLLLIVAAAMVGVVVLITIAIYRTGRQSSAWSRVGR